SLPTSTLGPSASRRLSASGNVPSQPGRLRALVTAPSAIVPGEPTPIPARPPGPAPPRDPPRRPTPDPGEPRRFDLRGRGRVAHRTRHRTRHVPRTAARGGGTARGAEHPVLAVHDHRLDLRPPEIDPSVGPHRRHHRA